MLQRDVITTTCLIILIEKLVLRVNTTKQHDVTTRQNNVVLFDHSPTINNPFQAAQPHTASNPAFLNAIGAKSPAKVEKYSI
jgi:hypothetical protein